MNEQQLLRDYEREALHQYRLEHYGQDNPSGHNLPSNAWEAMLIWLARIDWNRVFIWTARVLLAVAMFLVSVQYANYFHVFGIGALALSGQFMIGMFFMLSAFHSRDSLQIITAAIGMYILINSF